MQGHLRTNNRRLLLLALRRRCVGKRDTTILLAACAYAVRTDSGWKGKSPIQPAFVSPPPPPFSLDPTPPTAAGIDPTQEGGGSIELMILHPHSHPNPPSLFLGWGKNVKAAFLFFPFPPRSGHNKREEEEEEEEADSLEDCSQIDWRCTTVVEKRIFLSGTKILWQCVCGKGVGRIQKTTTL